MSATRSMFRAGLPAWSGCVALRPGSRWFPLVVLAWLALGAELASGAMRWQWRLPFCLLRALTGLPCPVCGCTRSLGAWAHLDLTGALRFSPLFGLGCLGLVAWALLGVVDLCLGTRQASGLEGLARRLCSVRLLLALTGLNWLYLCFNLPK